MSLYLQLPIEMLHRPINCLTVYRSERFSVVNVAKLFDSNATRLSKVKVVCLASTSNCIYRYVSRQMTLQCISVELICYTDMLCRRRTCQLVRCPC